MEGGIRNVNVYYLHHNDGLERLKPLLIVEGEKVWNGAVKHRLSRNPMYYIFRGSLYAKLWKDKKGNLLYYIDNYSPPAFYNDEPEVLIADLQLQWGEDTMWRIGEEKVKFSIPIFNVVRRLDEQLWRPVAYILGKLYLDSSKGQEDQNVEQQ